MYKVVTETEGKEYLLHDPRDNVRQLIDPTVTLEAGKTGVFLFRISPTHPNKDKILPLKSEISVYDDEELLFRGRHIGNEMDFWNVGKVTCEGELAYLVDSIQRPYTHTGGVADFFQQLITVHNSQMDERKHFKIGNITVPDTSPDVVRSSTECTTTLKTIRAQLTDANGGFVRVRYSGGEKYLDYVSDYGGINSQSIRFGENMVDLTRYIKPAGIITALVPYGATIKTEDAEEEEKRLDITSVNAGRDYITSPHAVNAYGQIWGTETFDDVTDPEALLAKARAYLEECTAMPETIELTAVDMGLLNVDVQKLKVGYWTNVISKPHGISKRFMLSKKVIHLDNPGKDKITLGKTLNTFTASTNKDQAQITERIERVAASTSQEINRKVENATQLITGGKGGYVVLDVFDPDTGEKAHPWRILVMDTPDKDTAKSVIQINKNGIGFSTTGINGPYANAWTIDGNLVADFITTGTMLADRIRGGVMELGGSGLGRDGAMIIKGIADDILGKIDKDGIQILLGDKVGFEANGVRIVMGGFKVAEAYGRQILQSTDEKTGMSGEPDENGKFYLWAGYASDTDYAFAVNNLKQTHTRQLYCHDDDDFYQGRTITDMLKEIYDNKTSERISIVKKTGTSTSLSAIPKICQYTIEEGG